MFWILVTAPVMLLALAVAVLPVLVTSLREARSAPLERRVPAAVGSIARPAEARHRLDDYTAA